MLNKAEADHQFGLWLDQLTHPQEANPTLTHLFSLYLEYLSTNNKTNPVAPTRFKTILDLLGPTLHASQLTPSMVRSAIYTLTTRGLKPNTTNGYLALCSAAWNRALPDKPNPFANVKKAKTDKLVRFLTPQEEAALLNAADTYAAQKSSNFQLARPLFTLAIHTGLRLSNLLDLTPANINLETNTIHVTQKGNRQFSAPLNNIALSTLKSLMADAPSDPSLPLFPGRKSHQRGTTRIHRGAALKILSKCLAIAGITKPFRFHDLRHHHATKLLRSTNNLALVSRSLGHASISTTMRYAHVLDQDLAKGLELLNNNQDAPTHTTSSTNTK